MMDLQVMMPQAYTPMPRLSTDASGWAASESRLGAGMGDLSNLDRNGRIISADDRQWFFKLGDRALDDRTKAEAEDLICWTIPEARSFLRDLTEHATQREFVYSHPWRQHDLVMWDNRTTMHRARRFDRTEIRDMRRTTLAGEGPTVEQVGA